MIIAQVGAMRHKDATIYRHDRRSFAPRCNRSYRRRLTSHGRLLDFAPIAAACFAVPEFLPQIRKLAATHDTSGLSWSWAALTSVNNAAWIGYFTLARYWTALIPSSWAGKDDSTPGPAT
jgi:hypothetical protein